MANDNKRHGKPTFAANKLVVNTNVLHQGGSILAHILMTAHLIDRVSDEALAGGIDDYGGDDTKAGAIESWIGRFATSELGDHGLGLHGWSANYNLTVDCSDAINPQRTLPFLVAGKVPNSYAISSAKKDPDIFAVEQAFTPRAMAFLFEKSIII